MVGRWLVGILAGTCIIAATSPWFVRSYVARVLQPIRNTVVLQPGARYRWRSEGYATSEIGPLGMPGQSVLPTPGSDAVQLALWGDSQAEGVCVDDSRKIPAVAAEISYDQCFVMPFARSGDDCNDWISQIASIHSESKPGFSLDAHVFLVVEWSDWCIDIREPQDDVDESFNEICETLPAFMIQAARHVLTTGENHQIRQLRFRPGPVEPLKANAGSDPSDSSDAAHVRARHLGKQLDRLRAQTDLPCIFVYAPLNPAIVGGEIKTEDHDAALFDRLRLLGRRHDFQVIDLRPAMKASVAAGRWPRGFQHGQFGAGHYNAIGNRIIARQIVEQAERIRAED